MAAFFLLHTQLLAGTWGERAANERFTFYLPASEMFSPFREEVTSLMLDSCSFCFSFIWNSVFKMLCQLTHETLLDHPAWWWVSAPPASEVSLFLRLLFACFVYTLVPELRQLLCKTWRLLFVRRTCRVPSPKAVKSAVGFFSLVNDRKQGSFCTAERDYGSCLWL